MNRAVLIGKFVSCRIYDMPSHHSTKNQKIIAAFTIWCFVDREPESQYLLLTSINKAQRIAETKIDACTGIQLIKIVAIYTIWCWWSPDGSPIEAFAIDRGRAPRMAEAQVDECTRVNTNHINSAIKILILCSPDGSPRPNRGFRQRSRQSPQNGRNTGWCTHES